MVNRPWPILHDIITTKQQSRGICASSPNCAYKPDVTKAYDRIDCNFLKEILLKRGFHSTWVPWMMCCVTTVRYSVNCNGVHLGTFETSRGLCQGDPLSPYLFLFVADSLSALLDHEQLQGRTTPLRVSRRAPVFLSSSLQMTVYCFSEPRFRRRKL